MRAFALTHCVCMGFSAVMVVNITRFVGNGRQEIKLVNI